MTKLIIYAVFIFFSLFGCTEASNMTFSLPDKNLVKSIYAHNINTNDSYLGLFELKNTASNGRLISDSTQKIGNVLNFIETNAHSWQSLEDLPSSNVNGRALTFLDENSKVILLVWIFKDQLVLLTTPIDPRNTHFVFQLNESAVQFFNDKLN